MTKCNPALLPLLILSLCGGGAAYADALPQEQADPPVISVYLDGKPLRSEVPPLNVGGTVLVPMRGLFEAQGAALSWDNTGKTVTATKDDTTLTYQMGAPSACWTSCVRAICYSSRHGVLISVMWRSTPVTTSFCTPIPPKRAFTQKTLTTSGNNVL
ncbi:hypothetical protein M2105_001037 [Paenibacillus sp. PastF-1]|nr:hypothetical protein [Paenibacillus sp. PastF-2]MDF9846456.1 hypothetical protein [Paenibacillus sp. PastM-2]MDF9853195.1 hypothetical protein [Paenibacillus sp. PastF-1]MDH6478301.1 hypothetical protein [Paenibacillus sp. PastH-2]MDH6506201.1 hypothetical protein [Paenibacillus sp. PastM-3]